MMLQRTLASCVFVLACMTWAVTTTAQDKDIEGWQRSTWQITLNLDTTNLVPPAVQWTILDKDPVPGFRARLKKMQAHHRKWLERADDEAKKELIRSSQMTAIWDLGFKDVTGDKVYLLTSAPGVSHNLSSNGPDGKKWIVTKVVRIKGQPVCWCIPTEVKTGNQIEVTLSEKTVFPLEAVYGKVMREQNNGE